MGWLFGYSTRKELIERLVSGNGVKTLKHCCKGNNLWVVHEGTYVQGPKKGEIARYVVLYMLRGRDTFNSRTGKYDSHGWGYKDIDGDSGPNYCNCPLSYLDGLDEAVSHGIEWREKVRKYHADRARRFDPGTKIRLFGRDYTVSEKLKSGYRVHGADGCVYRMPVKHIAQVEVLV